MFESSGYSHHYLVLSLFSIWIIIIYVQWYCILFNFHFLMIDNVKHFSCLTDHLYIFLWEVSHQSFTNFFTWSCLVLLVICRIYVYILKQLFFWYIFCEDFLLICHLLINVFNGVSNEQMFLIWINLSCHFLFL